MKVYLCALAKNEHLYINEWVNYYFRLGFDKIFIFDNDDKNSPNIKDYIDKDLLGMVRIINARGKHFKNIQGYYYTNFYNVEKDNFDYCLFCDIDEFLVGIDNIKKFLSKPCFGAYEQIRIKWKLYGDSDLIIRDMSKGVMETFTKPAKYSLHRNLIGECNLKDQGKSIVKGHLQGVIFDSVHYASRGNRILSECLPSGKLCQSGVGIVENYNNESVFINHYMTKSLSEFIQQKMNRTDAVFDKRTLDFNYYWRLNEKTQEKLDYIKDLGLND